MSSLFKKAMVSEKSFVQAAEGKFTFLVEKSADKGSIASECEKLFGVNVIAVNTTNYKGKVKVTKRIKGKRNNFKKAMVTLKPGQKIDLFELEVAEDKKAKAEKPVKAKAKEETTDVKTVIKKKGKEVE